MIILFSRFEQTLIFFFSVPAPRPSGACKLGKNFVKKKKKDSSFWICLAGLLNYCDFSAIHSYCMLLTPVFSTDPSHFLFLFLIPSWQTFSLFNTCLGSLILLILNEFVILAFSLRMDLNLYSNVY